MGLVRQRQFLRFGHALDPFALPCQPVERAEQEHEVACVAEVQTGLLAEAREVGAGVAAQVVRQLIVVTPEPLEGRGGDEQQPAGLERGARLTQGLQVVGQVLDHVQQEGDIPVIAPAQVHQVDLVALDTRGQYAAGHAQRRARGVGQGQWLVLPGTPVGEVAHPSAYPPPRGPRPPGVRCRAGDSGRGHGAGTGAGRDTRSDAPAWPRGWRSRLRGIPRRGVGRGNWV